jgi:hypothetical protein
LNDVGLGLNIAFVNVSMSLIVYVTRWSIF